MIKKEISRVEYWEVSSEAFDYLAEAWPYDGSVPDILECKEDDQFYTALYQRWQDVTAPKDAYDELYEIINGFDFIYGNVKEISISWQKEQGAQFVVEDNHEQY